MEKLSWLEIFISIIGQFTPVWIAMAIIFALSIIYKQTFKMYFIIPANSRNDIRDLKNRSDPIPCVELATDHPY